MGCWSRVCPSQCVSGIEAAVRREMFRDVKRFFLQDVVDFSAVPSYVKGLEQQTFLYRSANQGSLISMTTSGIHTKGQYSREAERAMPQHLDDGSAHPDWEHARSVDPVRGDEFARRASRHYQIGRRVFVGCSITRCGVACAQAGWIWF